MEEFESWTSILETLRAPALALSYSCIIEKEINFTHLSHKTFHISPSKTVYIYIFAIVTVHIYTITIAMHTIILLISQFRTFFSLSSQCAKRTQSQTSPFFIFFFFFYLDTPKNTHTNTCTQTNKHKDT